MPPTPTAPGVYIQELPSGSRSIAGVSTSLTVFVGVASRWAPSTSRQRSPAGPSLTAVGGLSATSTMTQTVRHYFQNGGSEALIVPVANGETLVLAATAAVVAVVGFDRLTATVGNVAGTQYDLTVALVDDAGAVIDDGNPYSATATLDAAAPDLTAIDGLATGHAGPVALINALGDAPTVVPAAGTTTAPAHTPGTVALGRGPPLRRARSTSAPA